MLKINAILIGLHLITHLSTFSCCPPIFPSQSRTGTGLNSKERVLSRIYPDLGCLNIGSRSLFSLLCSLKRAFRNIVLPRKMAAPCFRCNYGISSICKWKYLNNDEIVQASTLLQLHSRDSLFSSLKCYSTHGKNLI